MDMLRKDVKFSSWDKDKHDLQMPRNRDILVEEKLHILQEFYFYICIAFSQNILAFVRTQWGNDNHISYFNRNTSMQELVTQLSHLNT